MSDMHIEEHFFPPFKSNQCLALDILQRKRAQKTPSGHNVESKNMNMRNVRFISQYKEVSALYCLGWISRSSKVQFPEWFHVHNHNMNPAWYSSVKKINIINDHPPRINCFIQSRQITEQPTKAAVEVCELQSVCSHLLNNHMREQWDWLLRFPCLGSWHSTSCLSPLLLRIIQLLFFCLHCMNVIFMWLLGLWVEPVVLADIVS